jgi:hypothetical protein
MCIWQDLGIDCMVEVEMGQDHQIETAGTQAVFGKIVEEERAIAVRSGIKEDGPALGLNNSRA